MQSGAAGDEADTLIEMLTRGAIDAMPSAADRAMLAYALKLTRTPAAVRAGDVERLRHAGFNDRAIHDICAITAYFAFVNRIADGLGVEVESG